MPLATAAFVLVLGIRESCCGYEELGEAALCYEGLGGEGTREVGPREEGSRDGESAQRRRTSD